MRWKAKKKMRVTTTFWHLNSIQQKLQGEKRKKWAEKKNCLALQSVTSCDCGQVTLPRKSGLTLQGCHDEGVSQGGQPCFVTHEMPRIREVLSPGAAAAAVVEMPETAAVKLGDTPSWGTLGFPTRKGGSLA